MSQVNLYCTDIRKYYCWIEPWSAERSSSVHLVVIYDSKCSGVFKQTDCASSGIGVLRPDDRNISPLWCYAYVFNFRDLFWMNERELRDNTTWQNLTNLWWGKNSFLSVWITPPSKTKRKHKSVILYPNSAGPSGFITSPFAGKICF